MPMLFTVIIGLILSIVFHFFIPNPPQAWLPTKATGPHTYRNLKDFNYRDISSGIYAKFPSAVGAETIFWPGNETNVLFAGTKDGWLVRLEEGEGSVTKVAYIGGHALGGAFMPGSSHLLYLCVPPIGLVLLDIIRGTVQVVSSISDDELKPIRFADDVAALSSTGMIYFSDASRIAPWIAEDGYYDNLAASVHDAAQGSQTGRLLEYNPTTRKTQTLLKELHFANGVALSLDEDFLLVAETFAFRILRYWLRGPKSGTTDVFIDALPGMPDGVSTAPDGSFWVALVSEPTPLFTFVSQQRWLGRVIATLKRSMLPKADPYGALMQLSSSGSVIQVLADPNGKAMSAPTSVALRNSESGKQQRLYIGSLKHPGVRVLDLNSEGV